MIKIMKKNYLLLAVTAIMMSVGAYSLVDTKEASVLMSLKEVEALADQESDRIIAYREMVIVFF